jgi:hypothetical protein
VVRTGFYLVVGVLFTILCGCGEAVKSMQTTKNWHEKVGWKAEEYFDDPQVIALCIAIEANDIAEIDRLVAAGANVNAKGKGNMTPLLWAYPDNKLNRFKRLLEHGADPNVVIQSDFNTRGGMSAGGSVTHMACKTAFAGYFEAVFDHGGDANLPRTFPAGFDDTPLALVIRHGGENRKKKIRLLLQKGADLNYQSESGSTPALTAVSWGGQFDVALMLLQAGADPNRFLPETNSKLVHQVAEAERVREAWTPQQRQDFAKLVEWLDEHGESIEQAKADNARWESWSMTTGEYQRKMAAEVAARKAREARAAREKAANDAGKIGN